MPHILVVEDEQHLAFGIKFNLEAEGYTVTTAGDGPAALAVIDSAQPPLDLVVLDLMLPGMSGYAVCETLRGRGDSFPIVMLTARTLVEDRIRGFDAGADVYLQKPFDLEELLSVIRSLLSRRGRDDRAPEPVEAAATATVRFGSAEVDFETWEATCRGEPVKLTSLEMKLLKYLVQHEGKVVTRDELLTKVWGMNRPPATRTVDTFMLSLRKTFEDDPSRPVHFLSVRGTGYKFVSDRAAPTSIAAIPAASSRWTSARVLMPLSATSSTSSGTCSRSRSTVSRSVVMVCKSRLLMPTSVAPRSSTRGRFSGSWSSTSGVMPRSRISR
jgi:two-component system OmpR family response regulator